MVLDTEDRVLLGSNSVKDEPTRLTYEENDKILSISCDIKSEDKEKSILSFSQRRMSLLNNPNYGVILCFLDKFRAYIDLQEYPLHLLEENLLNSEENVSRRLIDLHIALLKRISLGKGAKRDNFLSIITKFAYRCNYEDGEYLKANGYVQAEIDIKLRILKNLLETQFDHNQGFKTALLEKKSFEIRSQPFGRDRSGASYWLFMDGECFMRLFRESADGDRTWTSIAREKDELEAIIKILITDHVVKKKFPDWRFSHEPFNGLDESREFESRYLLQADNRMKGMEEVKQETSPRSTITENAPKVIVQSSNCASTTAAVKSETQSDDESTHSNERDTLRLHVASSEDTNPNECTQEINNNQDDKQLETSSKKSRGRKRSSNFSRKKRRTVSNRPKTDGPEGSEVQTAPTAMKGRKRKQCSDNDEETARIISSEEKDQTKQVNQMPADDDSNNNENLPIALRRSKRIRKAPVSELSSGTSSPTKSVSQTSTKNKLANGKHKGSTQTQAKACSQSWKSNSRRRSSRRRGTSKKSANRCSSSSEEEQQQSDDEDEYNSDDYLPEKKDFEELDDDLLDEGDDDDEEFVPRRSAKTVAKWRGHMNENNVDKLATSSSSCHVCSKSDRPESLLLCDDCDDAYHLECLKPILLSVPDGDWYCPICEHKRLCNNLVDKLIQLIKEHEELEVKRNQCMSKRSNRLANVMLNLDRMVKRSTKKRRTTGVIYSDEENEEDNEPDAVDAEDEYDRNNDNSYNEEEQVDADDDGVYGFKDDGSNEEEKPRRHSSVSPRNRREGRKTDTMEKLGVRSCRRKPQNYRFDEYDKKMKEAMMEAGVAGDDTDNDTDMSNDEETQASMRKRAGYEKDEDFHAVGEKNDEEFALDPNRSSNESESEEDYDDDESSEDDDWKSTRRASLKKKPVTRASRRRLKIKSDDDDDSLSESELDAIKAISTKRSDKMESMELSETGNEDRRRSTRTIAQKSYATQQESDTDENDEDLFENGRPPPRRMRYKKSRGSDDSFIDDDDDYEKLARKRKIVKYGKSISRSSITDHIKKLVDEDEKPEDDSNLESLKRNRAEDISSSVSKLPGQAEPQPSDDDDFPDEQDIFKTNGLLKLQTNTSEPRPIGFRPPFVAPTHSYQHAIVDPTARFAMIRPSARPPINNGYLSYGVNNSVNENRAVE